MFGCAVGERAGCNAVGMYCSGGVGHVWSEVVWGMQQAETGTGLSYMARWYMQAWDKLKPASRRVQVMLFAVRATATHRGTWQV